MLHLLAYPPTCLLCGAPGALGLDLCAGCLGDLPLLGSACPRCAAPLPASESLCGQCQRQPPHFDRTTALCHYAPPADRLLLDLKFHTRLAHARLMGELMAAHLASRTDPLPECLLPVPLHPRRLRERGFNQALEIARPIAASLQLPIDTGHVQRIKANPPQSTLPAKRRRANVRGCFAVSGPLPWRHVALVDDVVTTGHTVNEVARVLRRAGVETVEVWAWARTSGY